jgi:murein DD-endopeptidase MepM/ murein hydrolase activator NlpD
MQRRHSDACGNLVRPVHQAFAAITRHSRFFLIVIIFAVVAIAGSAGYVLGIDSPTQAASFDDESSVIAFNDQLVAQDDLCSAVEQINLEEQLAKEKQKNDELADSLDSQKQESDSLEETILNALMANLADKMVSRSSSSLDSVLKEAKNLVTLNRKYRTFMKTDEADKVDLTSYKAAIDKKLLPLPTMRPVNGVMDGYGWRIHPIYGYRQFHAGCDIGAPYGARIKAAGAGRVVEAGYDSRSGRYVKINHGNGFVTFYLHCSKLLVTPGEYVKKGEVIAKVGSTGTSTGPHLHFQVEYYGTPINPRRIIME